MTVPDGKRGHARDATATPSYWNITRLKRRQSGSTLFVESDDGHLLGYVKVIHSQSTNKVYLNAYTLDDTPVGSFATFHRAQHALAVACGHHIYPKNPPQSASKD